jgi:hypothetical protein
LEANAWAKDFLPNAFLESGSRAAGPWRHLLLHSRKQASALQSFLELPLRGEPGDMFEAWEMNRKIARFAKQAGFGEETIFNAEVCQGNFHHHRKWTSAVFEEKLAALAAVRGGAILENPAPGMAMEADKS